MLLFLIRILGCALVLKIVATVLLSYPGYFPPDFSSHFLQGREAYFWNGYQWVFYAHIVAGPLALVVGLILMSKRVRLRHVAWHRRLGQLQTALVLILVVPSGIWMASYAETGRVAGFGFTTLSLVTALCTWMGWRSAVQGFASAHARWMARGYVLLCSAVVLRIMGGAFQLAGISDDRGYAFAAWLSWLFPLAAFEVILCFGGHHRLLRW